ncbi:MAG: peptidoglycan DD-metalloendopeptidase family protein [Bacteroidota bacterium]
MRIFWRLIFVILFIPAFANAQRSRSDLEKEKAENLKKISEAERILKETESKKVNTIGQLQAINQKIKAQNQLISSIKKEKQLLDEEIAERNIVINALSDDLENLKEEYGKMIFNTYKYNSATSKLSFLFSASTFTQLMMRLEYLKQYSKARRVQVEQIELVKMTLSEEKLVVEDKLVEKRDLLGEQIKESKSLSRLKTKQNDIVTNLKSQERELKKEVASRKKSIAKLNKIIEDLVKAELAKVKSASVKLELTEMTSSFERSKKNLSWPVQSGFVSSPFGRQQHPVLKGIQIENHGIEIQTESNQSVHAVFEGEIASVSFVPGMNNVVLVKHGDYYTLYAKIKNVTVKRGDIVSSNQKIGEVFTSKDGISELQFQVWKRSNKLNPEHWLAKR